MTLALASLYSLWLTLRVPSRRVWESYRGTSAELRTSTTAMAQQTTLDEWAKDPLVDPEVRAHVYSLISAVSIILNYWMHH